jgi:hypothetical protein
MKFFVKLLIVVTIFCITTQTYSQKFAVKGGLNLSNMVFKEGDSTLSDDYESNIGFHLGGTFEIPMVQNFSLEPGIFVSTKGVHQEVSQELFGVKIAMKMNMNLYYIDIPFNAKYAIKIGDNRLYGLLGPYLGVGLTGKLKTESTVMNQTEKTEETIIFDSKKEEFHLNRFDYGLQFGAGVEIKSFLVCVSYSYGIGNILPNTENDSSVKNTVLSISLGYVLNK